MLLPTSSAAWHGELQIDHDGYQRKLATIIKRLKDHLKLQKWPKLTHVEVEGRRFKLPVRLDDVDPECIAALAPEIDEEYAAGFFDGDGCVSVEVNLSGCRLILDQSVKNCAVLFRFLVKFGGGIYLSNSGCGNTSPVVSWRAHGETARQAASVLHRNSLVKEEELGIAMSWPRSAWKRKECHARLGLLKKQAPHLPSNQALSWTYFAGFFDAEGCICMSPRCKAFQLEIGQRHSAILQAIHGFLREQLPLEEKAVRIYNKQSSHVLVCARSSASTIILRKLVEHGLQGKRQEGLTALSMSNSSHSNLRRDLGLGKGRQSFFLKLDEDGCTRAREISKLTSRLWHVKRNDPVMACGLEVGLTLARLEHKVLNAQTEIQKLRSFIAAVKHMRTIENYYENQCGNQGPDVTNPFARGTADRRMMLLQ